MPRLTNVETGLAEKIGHTGQMVWKGCQTECRFYLKHDWYQQYQWVICWANDGQLRESSQGFRIMLNANNLELEFRCAHRNEYDTPEEASSMSHTLTLQNTKSLR